MDYWPLNSRFRKTPNFRDMPTYASDFCEGSIAPVYSELGEAGNDPVSFHNAPYRTGKFN